MPKKNLNTKQATHRISPAIAKLVKQRYGMAFRVARLAGCGRSYVSDILAGRKAPSKKFLKALVQALSKDSEMTLSAAASIELLQMMEGAKESGAKDSTQEPGSK